MIDPRDIAAATIAKALSAIADAYWRACDAEGVAIDPEDLGVPDGLLDGAYETALRVEEISQAQGIDWIEARQFV